MSLQYENAHLPALSAAGVSIKEADYRPEPI